MSRTRQGFTLVELLVVIAIIGILVAMLLPAVQSARESARRTTCVNNFKQLGIALHNYHDVYKRFPAADSGVWSAAGTLTYNDISEHARLLPFLEQQPVYNLISFSVKWNDPLNAPAMATRIPCFMCPSDSLTTVPDIYGPNNYFANQGRGLLHEGVPPTNPANLNYGMPGADGVFYGNSFLTFADIRDGTSHTAAFSERVIGDFNQGVATEKSDTFAPGTYPASLDQAVADCRGVNINDLTKQGYSNVGAPWLEAYHSTTYYNHNALPNERSCMYPPGRIMVTANSYHAGGVNLLYCDGSVTFVTEQVSIDVWRAIGTRAGKEGFQSP